MDLEPHRYIVAVRIEKEEESGEPVTIVTTNLNINPDNPAFNKVAFDDLRNHVEKWQREHVARATIEGHATLRLAELEHFDIPPNAAAVNYRLFPSRIEDGDLIFFHSTAVRNRDSILLNGFEIPSKTGRGILPTISFGASSLTSYDHAMRSRKDGEDWCILVVRYPTLDLPHLPKSRQDFHDAVLNPQPEIIGYMLVPRSYHYT